MLNWVKLVQVEFNQATCVLYNNYCSQYSKFNFKLIWHHSSRREGHTALMVANTSDILIECSQIWLNGPKGVVTLDGYQAFMYKEWVRLAHSLLIHFIKHYIFDDAVLSIDTCLGSIIIIYWTLFRRKISDRPCCGTAKPAQTLARTCTSWQIMWLTQSATQETRYLCHNLTRKSSQEKTPRIESLPSLKLPCITSTPESSSFAVTRLPHVSLPFDLILFGDSCEALSIACS